MEFHYSLIPIPIAAGRTNTALRSMEPGLTTAAFGTKAQSAIANKNAELRREISSSGDKMTVTDTSGPVENTQWPLNKLRPLSRDQQGVSPHERQHQLELLEKQCDPSL